MQGGKLRHRLTIQIRAAITPDSFGADTAAWTDLVTVFGSVEPLSGNKLIAASQISPELSHEIRLRFRSGVSPRNRLAWRLYTFTAVAATDVITVTSRAPRNGDRVRLVNSGGALPAGLIADKDYFVRDASGQTCKLSATLGGAAIDLTGAGTGTHYFGQRTFDVLAVRNANEKNRELLCSCKEVP